MKFCFFLFHFNDIDHLTPVIWAALKRGHRVQAVMLDPTYETAGDPRLSLLADMSGYGQSDIAAEFALPLGRWIFALRNGHPRSFARRVARALLRKTGISTKCAARVLRNFAPDACVFEWGGPGSRGRSEFFAAAKQLGIRTAFLPHGMNIYLNTDVTSAQRANPQRNNEIRNWAVNPDDYVFQSEHHRTQSVESGMREDITRVMGSARFCPEWLDVNSGLYPEFRTSKETKGRLKIIFMMPHWNYNVHRQATLDAIVAMARHDGLFLVIKDHTRGTGALPEAIRDDIEHRDNVEIVPDVSSTALMRWSDVVINFGSSIGLEALSSGTAMVNPSYLHSNQTVFDQTGAGHRAKDLDELMAVLDGLAAGSIDSVSPGPVADLEKILTYGGREPFDVLGAYCDLLEGKEGAAAG